MRNLMPALLVTAGCAVPAYAQADNTPFTGARVEALLGYDQLRSGDDDDDGVDTGEDEGDETLDGAVYGVGAGFDFDLGGVVAGVEAEYADSTGEQEADETLDGIPFTSRIETGRDIYIGGRLGFRVAPTTLVYGKAGYTNTSIEFAAESSDERFELDSNVDGWRLGAGIEQLFGPNLYGKVEYRYSNYNNLDFSDDFDFEDFEAEDFDTDIDLDRHQVLVGLGMRF